MSLTFNIVYTPGTVAYLSFFVHSLLKWSNCRFRLVSNGCLLPERRLLQQLCRQQDRLEYFTVPTNGMADHGTVLNYLQTMTTEDYFCFMDSDLFATGNFVGEFLPYLDDNVAVFSGTPVWMTFAQGILPAAFQTVSGVHHQTDDGICLGSTYFAIYDNRVLTDCMQSTGIGFQSYQWAEVPREFQQTFTASGLQKQNYDTAKVLNLVLQQQGRALRYTESARLCHIGGFSFLRKPEPASESLKSRAMSQLLRSPIHNAISTLQKKWRSKMAWRDIDGMSESERQALIVQRLNQRDPTRRYFRDLLTALIARQPLPDRPTIGNTQLDAGIATATENIRTLYEDSTPGRPGRRWRGTTGDCVARHTAERVE